ncbi:MAG: helical backbone metal receptor [Vicinamibacterales bacterium]|jgi:iron complex transport system substrate-binding protein|nr:helical backbone metal receptor [Vicinamibacterales bacterium]
MTDMLRRRVATITCLVGLLSVLVGAQGGPRRIVSVVPALTEALFAIGAGPDVVGVGSFDSHPPEVASRPRVGGLLDPDMEQIFRLRPDLVILYGSQRDQIEQLTRAGIPVFSYAHGGVADTLSVIRQLGTRTGRADDAARVSAAIETQLADVRARVGDRERPRVLLVFGREPGSLRNIYASGGIGFLHDMLEAAGGANVFADVPRESVQLTSEAILTAAPEAIIELTYDDRMTLDTQAAEIAVWNRLSSVPAVRNRRVRLLLGNQFVQPGPRLGDATAAIARALHPEAF